MASAWTEIGLEPTIEKGDIGKVISDASAGDFDVVYLWIGLVTDPARPYDYFDEANANHGLSGLLRDEALSKKVNEARAEQDETQRKALYADILAENYAHAATYYTVTPEVLVGVGPRLAGYEQGTFNVIYEGGGLPKACPRPTSRATDRCPRTDSPDRGPGGARQPHVPSGSRSPGRQVR